MVHRLYLDEPCQGRLGKSTEYAYEDGVLEIRWCGEQSWHYFPPKTAVVVKCRGCMPEVEPVMLPKAWRWRVLWLCGVPKNGRCGTMEEYEAIVRAHQGGPVRHEGGQGWQIARALGTNGRDYVVAGYAAHNLREAEARKMIRSCHVEAPEWFVNQVLRKG